MSEQEKQLKRIVDLLESHLGDSDNYLPEEPMTPSEFEEEYPVEAAMQIAVKLMLDARIAPTQGADARPVASDAVLAAVERMCQPLHESRVSGVTAQEDARCMALIRDYVLATRDAAPSDAISPEEHSRIRLEGYKAGLADASKERK